MSKATSRNAKYIYLILATFVAIIVLSIAGYQFGWWLKGDSTDRQTELDNTRSGTQSAWRDEAMIGIRDVERIPEGPARNATITQTCDLISKLTGTFADDEIIVEFKEQYCV